MEQDAFIRATQEVARDTPSAIYSIAGRVNSPDPVTMRIGVIWKRSEETGIRADILLASTVRSNDALLRYPDQPAPHPVEAVSRYFTSVPVRRDWERLGIGPLTLRVFAYMQGSRTLPFDPPNKTRAVSMLQTLETKRAWLRLDYAPSVTTLGGVSLTQVEKLKWQGSY